MGILKGIKNMPKNVMDQLYKVNSYIDSSSKFFKDLESILNSQNDSDSKLAEIKLLFESFHDSIK